MLRFKEHLRDNYHLADKDWEIIKEYFEHLDIRKNKYFVQKGKVCHRLAFIAEGSCAFVCKGIKKILSATL
ncbi:MAG: hypothetical protein ABI760_07940 [Ferruginibacter sp.]